MKRWTRLAIVGGSIIVMLAVLLILRSTGDEPEPDPFPAFSADDPDRVLLLDNQRDQIARITVERADEVLTIVRDEETERFWPVYEHDVAFNSIAVNRVVSGVTSMSSRRVIGEVEELADYGLHEPVVTVSIELVDGSVQQLLVGAQNPARDSYYVQRSDDPIVYVVFDTWITGFFTRLDEMRQRVLTQVDVQRLERVVLRTLAGRTIRVERRSEWEDDPELGFSSFAVYEPFRRRYQLNTNWIEELGTQVPQLRIGRYVDDAPTNLARYGLAPPRATISISDTDRTLELLVGDETEGGRYAKLPGRPSVFVLSGAEPIITVRPYSVVSAFSLIINIDLVDTFVVEGPGQRHVGRIEREEVEGEEFPEETYFLDGREMEEKAFKQLYQWAIGLLFDVEAPQGAADLVGQREPLLTITYNLLDGRGPLTVSFEPYDATYALVVRDGHAEFLIARAKLQRLLDAYRNAHL